MAPGGFHDKPFDEGTLVKLRIFELYAREWLPVFLANPDPIWRAVHVFDFFAGAGTDSEGVPGSPLRLLRELRDARSRLPGWSRASVHAHFSDAHEGQVERLRKAVAAADLEVQDAQVEIRIRDFRAAFQDAAPILRDAGAAKLVLIDQCGVEHVDEATFRALVGAPRCDFLFFISSSTLHRFRDHPAIKQKIDRPDDYYHVHRAVTEYYRTLLPSAHRYFLGRFSIKKGANIYGLIFGSAHPRGMDKFIQVAWKTDEISGEADFDIDRNDCGPLLTGLLPPTKVTAFEQDLESGLLDGSVKNEVDVIDLCFQHGVKRQHSVGVLDRLKRSGIIDYDFRSPSVDRWRSPGSISLRANGPTS